MKGSAAVKQDARTDGWRDFQPGDWISSINVRDFIVRNVTSYAGD
jgi:formate C-acetyltransferase